MSRSRRKRPYAHRQTTALQRGQKNDKRCSAQADRRTARHLLVRATDDVDIPDRRELIQGDIWGWRGDGLRCWIGKGSKTQRWGWKDPGEIAKTMRK